MPCSSPNSHPSTSDPLSNESAAVDEEAILNELRKILLAPEQAELDSLRADVAFLQTMPDEERLLEKMTPLVNRVIEKQIRESPQEVIELLYPLLGGMVWRTVQEALNNLADRIDAQRRKMFSLQRFFSSFTTDRNGVSSRMAALRDALPFSVEDLFIIHHESGLLIHHEFRNPPSRHDADLISAMLTAIGDFVKDTMGQDTEGVLKEIEYGDKRILIEMFQRVYVAAVIEGFEPSDYRHKIRSQISKFERQNRAELSDYGGMPSRLYIHTNSLRQLLD